MRYFSKTLSLIGITLITLFIGFCLFTQEAEASVSFPSTIVGLKTFSVAEQKALELTKDYTTPEEKFNAIYSYVVFNCKYDYEKAIASNGLLFKTYEISPDRFLIAKSGICIDYSSCVVYMLRTVDVPAMVCIGYAPSGGGGLHAWIEVYLDNTWKMYDPTFASISAFKTKHVMQDGYVLQHKF